ncbi:CapE family protein [Peribacillus muralis]|nr:CapE family protein [Peribacillus muralis]MCK1991983.1 CapE family protein [Peribacillus muralis]MCK2012541.1 CapE family protein [Peribacillus muralis]
MNTVKKIASWVLPVVLIAALLVTMNTFKRTETLTPDEQKKIERYTAVEE